jgi:anti-sigma factor RsiW
VLLSGTRAFTFRSYPQGDAATTMAALLEALAPEMTDRGYRITQRSDGRLRFERMVRAGLFRKRHEAVMIDIDEGDRGTQVVTTGVAPRTVRRLLRDLGD